MKTNTQTRNPTVQSTLALALLALALSGSAFAANRTWTNAPVDGNWSTAANWMPGGAVTANDALFFTNSAITSVTNDALAANANINGLNFAAGGDAFTLWGTGIALNGNITNASANSQVLNLDTLINGDRMVSSGTNVTFGGLALNSGNNRTLFGYLTGGTLFLNNVTLSEAAATVRTFLIAGGATGAVAQANAVISGVVANGSTAASTLAYFGTGTLKLNGSAPSTHGINSVTAGTLLLDFANLSPAVNLLNSASTLTLGGGTYSILGKSSGSTFQTNGNLTLTGGTGSGIALNNNGGAGTTLRLGSLGGRGGNSTLQVDTSAGGTLLVGTTPGTANGILNPAYATINDGSGVGFATTNGSGQVIRYTGGTALVDTANDPTANYTYAASGSTFNWNNGITSRGANSLAIDTSGGSGVLDLGGAANVLTNSSRALLMKGANNFTIQNGQVGSAGVEQMVQVTGPGALTIAGTVGSGTASLTKGGNGTLILTAANNYSNGTFVTKGTLKLGAANALGASDRNVTVGAGGILDLNGFNLGVNFLNGNGGGIIINNGAGAATLTIGNNNAASSGTTVFTIADGASPLTLLKVGTGQIQLSGASAWSGGTTITGGNANGIRVNHGLSFGTGPVTLNDGGIFITSANPLAGGLGYAIANSFVIVGNSANNVLQNDASGFNWNGNITGSGTVKVHAGTRAGANAVFNGDLSGLTGTFNIANGSSSTFQARLTQNGSAATKFALSTTGSQLSFNGTGAGGTNVVLGELSGVSGTTLAGDNASKIFTVGALGTSTTFGGAINNGNVGVHSLVKVGAGSLTVGSAAGYTGTTVVSNGLLFVNGLASTNTVNIFAPGAFGGSGNVAGPVVLSSGNAGLLLTNNAVGTFSAGDLTTGLTLDNGNLLAFDCDTPGTCDNIIVNGAFSQTGTATVFITKLANFAAGTYDLLTASSGISSANFSLGNTLPGYGLSLSSPGGTILRLTVTVVAPPAAFWHNRSGVAWTNGNNWDTDQSSGSVLGTIPLGPTDVTFASDGAPSFNTTLGADFGIHNLVFNTPSPVTIGGANTLTLNGNLTVNSAAGAPAITANGVNLGADATWTIANAATTLSVSSSVGGGARALTVSGPGTLALSGTNTYTGGTFVTAGATLTLKNPVNTLADTAPISVDGGTLDINTNTDIVGILGLTNGAIVGTSGVLTGSVYYVENGTVSARLGGNAGLTKANLGNVLLSGNNSFSGPTTIAAGTLLLGSSTALGNSQATVVSGATLDLNGQATANVVSASGAGVSDGAIINSSNAPAVINSEIVNGSSYTVNATGDITIRRTRSGGGTFTLTKDGPGALVLGTPAAISHNNLLQLAINDGTVVLNMPSFLAVDRGITINNTSVLRLAGTGGNQIQDDQPFQINGGTFDLNGLSENIGHLNGLSTAVVTNGVAGTNSTLTVGPGALTADGSGQFDGVLVSGAGTVALTKAGSGALTLTGVNTYTGNTTISAGTLALSEPGSIGGSAVINIVSGASLDVTARTDQTLTLQSGQTLMGNGGLNGNLVTLPGSTVNPGASVGTLIVTNNITLGGRLLLELNRTNTPSSDKLVSDQGTITYGGTLSVTNIGPALQVNDSFQLFPAAVTAFTSISLATTDATGNLYTWTNRVPLDGSIQVLTVVPPVTTNAYLSALTLTPAATLTPAFSSNVLSYTATEAYTNSPVTVTPTSADTNATIRVIYAGATNTVVSGTASGPLALDPNPLVGNVIDVRVTAQDAVTLKDYVLTVTRQPSLAPPALSNSVSGNTLTLAWPLANSGYRLLVQTNNLDRGISLNTNDWAAVSGAAVTNQLAVPLVRTNVSEFYRLVYP